jgi:hypothetical protein
MNRLKTTAVCRIILMIISVSSLALLVSCASSRLTASWYDDSFQQKKILDDVLVIAVVKEETVRRLYEDSFVEKLASKDTRAIASYSLAQPDIQPEEEAIIAAIKEAGAQSVLITRHLGTDTKQHYRPPERYTVFADPYYGRMSGYYPMAHREVYSPGYDVTVTTVSLEANLYDVKTGKLVWSARSESVDPKMTKKFLDELVAVFTSDLKSKDLL